MVSYCITHLMLGNKYLQTLMSKNSNNHLLSLTTSVGQVFGNALARWFWHMVSHEIVVRCQPVMQLPAGLELELPLSDYSLICWPVGVGHW